MDFDELFIPPDIANDFSADVLTKLFGGIITKLHSNGDASVVTTNWLETIFTTFNAVMLLAVLVMLSYTIYAMVLDTASDGKTFGQTTDTKYTIVRSLIGIIGFVPLAGGFSLVQVFLLWLVLQGSALADVMWRNVASNMLAGTPLVSASLSRVPPQTDLLTQQFGVTFDALVTGHICAINANSISRTLAGDTNITPAEISSTGPNSVVQLRQSPLDLEDTSGFWNGVSGRQVVGMNYQLYFGEEAGGSEFSGRGNYCGSVTVIDSYTASSDGSGGLSVGLTAGRQQQQFAHLVQNVLPDLSTAAQVVAFSIYGGERDSVALLEPSRDAVYVAVGAYLGGPAIATSIDSDVIEDIHDGLLTMVTTEGWMLAPIWQRGVASTASSIEFPGDTLTIDATRRNEISDFLTGEGYNRDRGGAATDQLLAKVQTDQDTWNELASNIINLSLSDVSTPTNSAMGDVPAAAVNQKVINGIYRGILNIFSPVATQTASGNFGFVDPMLQVQRQGTILASTGSAALAGGIALEVGNQSIVGRGADFFLGIGEAVSMASSGLTSAGTTLLVTGLIMMIILPLVPMIYFFSAILTWLIQILELMFAVPMTLLRLLLPSSEGRLIGSDLAPTILAMVGVALRPVFIIIGLVLAMIITSVMLYVLHEFFGKIMFFDGASGMDTSGSLASLPGLGGAASAVDSAMGLLTMIFLLVVYVLLAFLTVVYGSQLISEFGEAALNLLGAGFGRFSQAGTIADKTVLGGGLGYMGARNLGAKVGSGQRAIRQSRNENAGNDRLLPGRKG